MNDYLMYNGELYHFNPFHDRMGRFASSRGGMGARSSRGMSGLYGYFGPKKPKEETTGKASSSSTSSSETVSGTAGSGGKKNSGGKGDDDKTPDTRKLVKGMFKDASEASSNAAKLRENVRRNEAARQVSAIDISSMSDAELKRQIDRMTLEKRYREVKAEDIKRGKDRMDEVLEYSAAILGIASSAVAIAAAIKTIKGKNE